MATSGNLEDLHVDELRERAKKNGVANTSHMKKSELIEALAGEIKSGGSTQVESRTSGRSVKRGGEADGRDAIELLIADHREVKRLFEDALDRDDDDEQLPQIAAQIVRALELHTRVEETIFYPAVKEAASADDEEETVDEVVEAYVEHGSVKELIAKLRDLDPTDESYHAILKVMSEQVEHHVEEEEGELFPSARELLGEQVGQLGEAIAAAKRQAG
jgi:hemerythrin superfamily protein